MTIENKVDELERRIEKLKQYYHKGFVNILAGIMGNAENYINYPEEREKPKKEMLSLYSEIEEFYQNIPFDGLNSNEDFAPLFVVRKLLPKFKTSLDKLLEQTEREVLEDLFILSKAMTNVGEVYRGNILGLIDEVRKVSGNEDYNVRIVDKHGREYTFF